MCASCSCGAGTCGAGWWRGGGGAPDVGARPSGRPRAAPDGKRRVYVNYEIFYLPPRDALERFRKHTLQYCGWLTDPVNGARFRPTASSPRMTYNGRYYYFSTISNRMKFEARPDSFAVRKGS